MRTCRNCGKSIEHRHHRAIYCDSRCRDKVRRPARIRPTGSDLPGHGRTGSGCAHCGTALEGRPAKTRYCNDVCRKRHNRQAARLGRTCGHCGSDMSDYLYGKKFCSASCRRKSEREANIEGSLQYEREWRAKNAESVRAAQRNYAIRHPERVRRKAEDRRHLRNNPGRVDFGPTEWRAICRHWRWSCAYCGATDTPLTMDHIVPLARGGRHAAANIAPACGRCNSSKGKKFLAEWNRDRRRSNIERG